MSKCVYCNKNTDTLHPVVVGKDKETVTCCCDDCDEKTLAFYQFVDRTKPLFIIGIVFSLLAIFAAVFVLTAKNLWLGGILLGSGFALLGLTVIIFPFGTPQTFELFGIRKTLWIVRIMGVIVILLSPLMAFFVMTP